jgi:3-isopropylmalate/(R)-2-methylmalate dehydratase small subunit
VETRWISRGHCHVYGADVVHDNGLIDFGVVRARETDAAILKPLLLKPMDDGFASRVKPNDFLIAGQRFGSGKAHITAYIAMAALNMRVLCESSFANVVMGAANVGLPILSQCEGVSAVLQQGEEIEVDLLEGTVLRLSTGETLRYPPLPEDQRQIIELGGRKGILQKYLEEHPLMKTPFEIAS